MGRVLGWAGGVVARVLEPLVAEQVRRAVAEHEQSRPHLAASDLLEESQVYGDRDKLHLHPTTVVNDALFNLSSGHITVEEYAFFGHGVSVLTGTHDVTAFDAERQVAVPKSGRDVVIGRGVWVSSNATVLGPCRIGEHAVVAAGALVTGDVEPYAIVAGVPAKQVQTVPRPDGN
jgi:acetyltransferase-like isoleucine patch superfamily enzyme